MQSKTKVTKQKVEKNSTKAEAIRDLFDNYSLEDIQSYLQEVFVGYLGSPGEKSPLELANMHWFTVELGQFFTAIEPIDNKKRRLQEEIQLIS